MSNLTTRKIVLGLLMALVLAFRQGRRRTIDFQILDLTVAPNLRQYTVGSHWNLQARSSSVRILTGYIGL